VNKTKKISEGIGYLYKIYPKHLNDIDKKNELKLFEHMYVYALSKSFIMANVLILG
jgi:hypothetical protein